MNDRLEIKAMLQVLKPVPEVFEAIVDPGKMSNYFISYGSGRLEEGKTIHWRFPEFDAEFPVVVGKVVKDSYVSFTWEDSGENLLVEISLSPARDAGTIVTVTEKSRANDEAGIRWLQRNTEGWANFLACLKAYLEYGINLRRGGFDFMKAG
jgi:uncharacterized protein YndB with AHSA1/START domain